MASSPSPDSTTSALPPPSTSTPSPSSTVPQPTTSPSPPSAPTASPSPLNDVPPPQVTSPPPQPSKPPESSPTPPSGVPRSSRPPPPPTPPQPPERSPSPPDNSPPPEPSNPGNPPPQPPVVPTPERPPQAPTLSPGGNSSSSGGGNSSPSPVPGPPGNISPPQPARTVPSPPRVQFPPPRSSGNPPPSSQSPVTPSSRPSARETSNSTDDGGVPGGVLALGIGAGVVVLAIVGLAFWFLCNRRRRKRHDLKDGYFWPESRKPGFNSDFVMPAAHGSHSDLSHSKTHSLAPNVEGHSGSRDFVYSSSESRGSRNSRPWFTYEELYKATNAFSVHNLLGEGGFGSVYKGFLPDGRVIAVKNLKVGGGQGKREFKAEVEIISRIHHRHLVSLVGYCISQDQRLLAYDYVANNTLYFHLHGEGRPLLDWAIRVKVAAGAARGIAYLHEDCDPRIIHRDIKSSNILLDNNFEARVSDFGLAKLFLDADTHVTTRVVGTFGYMAPEYASSGKLTEKSDVFSFGVVLLELITGRKPVDNSLPAGNGSLVEWARPLLSHALETEDFEDLIDPKLGKNYVKSELLRMIEAAAACVRHLAAKRPRMGQIVRTFDTLDTSDLNNGMRPGESEIYNRGPQSTLVRLFERMAHGGGQDNGSDFFSGDSLNTKGSL